MIEEEPFTERKGGTVQYRLASLSDWNSLACFRNLYSAEGFEKAKKAFEIDFVDSPKMNVGKLFVALLNREIVGYGRVGLHDPNLEIPIYGQINEVPQGYYTKGILVHEKVRGKGVGIKLTELRGDWVRERDSSLYCILQRDNKVSVDMHLKVGFREVKRGLKYPSDTGDMKTGILLEWDLR